VRLGLEQMTPIGTLEASWEKELDAFDAMRRDFFLYASN